MRKHRIWMGAFLVTLGLLVSSNLWWFNKFLDQLSIQKYIEGDLYECTHERETLEAMCLDLNRRMIKEDVLKTLAEIHPGCETFEKHGFLNTTWVSFRFDEDGRLIQVTTDDQVVLGSSDSAAPE